MKAALTTALATLAIAVLGGQTELFTDFVTLVLGGLLTPDNARLLARIALPTLIVVGVVVVIKRTGHRVQRGRWSEDGEPVEVLKVSREDLDHAVAKSVKATVNGDIRRVVEKVDANTEMIGELRKGQTRIHERVDDVLKILAAHGANS